MAELEREGVNNFERMIVLETAKYFCTIEAAVHSVMQYMKEENSEE